MDSPISGSAKISASYDNATITYDSHVFPPETNKIVKMGKIRSKTFNIICDGNGHITHKLMDDPLKTIERLRKLLDNGTITQDEFDQKKKELLGNL